MQNWTKVILSELAKAPRTVAQLHALPHIARMRAQHIAQRKQRGAFIAQPINSMTYDTLYRLRKRGIVRRDEQGVYHLTDNCPKCGGKFVTHNDDGSCVKD